MMWSFIVDVLVGVALGLSLGYLMWGVRAEVERDLSKLDYFGNKWRD